MLARRAKFGAAGSIIGLLSSAVLASVAGLSVTLAVIGAVLIAWGVLLVARMPEDGFTRQNVAARTRFGPILAEGLAASRGPALRVLLTVTVLTGFASEAVDRLGVARLAEVGFPESVSVPLLVGGAAVAESTGAILILIIFGRNLAGRRLVDASITLHALTGVGVVLLARSNLLALALVGVVVQGMVREVAETVTIGWTNHFTESAHRATVHSFVGQAMSLGEISGGIVLGLLAQRAGITSALSVSAGIYFVAAAVARRAKTRWARD